MRFIFGLILFLLSWTASGDVAGEDASKPPPADRLAFEAATRALQDGDFDRAARDFDEFTKLFPESPLKGQAAERALLARGEGQLKRREFGTAAETFAQFQKSFPESDQVIFGLLGEAESSLRGGDASRSLRLLEDSKGRFMMALEAGAPTNALFQGLMLKGEAFLQTTNAAAALIALDRARPFAQKPMDEWQRLRWVSRANHAAGKLDAALESALQLRALSTNDALAAIRPESTELWASLLESAGQGERARRVWEENLATNWPVGFRREAALRIAESHSKEGNFAAAFQRLESYVQQSRDDPRLDRSLLFSGQLLLRQFQATSATNRSPPAELVALLSQAASRFDQVITNYSTNATAAIAIFEKGWCGWEEFQLTRQTNRLVDASAAFQAAASQLPPSLEQAVARLKWADCLAAQDQDAAALTNYLFVARGYEQFPDVQLRLGPSSLGQAIRMASELGETNVAVDSVFRLLSLSPEPSQIRESSSLVIQALARVGGASSAQAFYDRLVGEKPEIPGRAEVELSLATAYLREERWTNALGVYSGWFTRFTNHPATRRAEFDRARAAEKAGLVTNSAVWFGELASKNPTNRLGLMAQLWLGSHFFERQEFVRAQSAYVSVITNASWRGLEDWYRAHLLAARAALASRLPNSAESARTYLTDLINDLLGARSSATNLLAQAFFGLGDCWQASGSLDRTNQLANFGEAITAYRRVERAGPGEPLVAAAWGAIGDCHFQLGFYNRANYQAAAENYLKVVGDGAAPISLRSKAKVGLGQVAERLEQPDVALGHYQDVLYGKVLREGEEQDPYWTQMAGRNASQLLEMRQRWDEAIKVNERLATLLPNARPAVEERIARLREQQVRVRRTD